MKGFVGTVVSGAIGLAALYVVGRVAFQAGHDIAEAECRYEQLQRGIDAKTGKKDAIVIEDSEEVVEEPAEIVPEKKQSKLGMLFGLRKIFGKKGTSVVGDLIQNPENHVIEACVKGREIHVNVKPRTA
ncbi:MAG: hypothetical protein IJ523_07135 [Succinivibrionaceae bacterium]|nr:hypothetical protein [Succinivibrionaceae bacterium]MBQ9611330.1 hypothetical protein [Lachnospiraceae bacterium]